jgi:hypothetical protein
MRRRGGGGGGIGGTAGSSGIFSRGSTDDGGGGIFSRLGFGSKSRETPRIDIAGLIRGVHAIDITPANRAAAITGAAAAVRAARGAFASGLAESQAALEARRPGAAATGPTPGTAATNSRISNQERAAAASAGIPIIGQPPSANQLRAQFEEIHRLANPQAGTPGGIVLPSRQEDAALQAARQAAVAGTGLNPTPQSDPPLVFPPVPTDPHAEVPPLIFPPVPTDPVTNPRAATRVAQPLTA